MKQVMAANALLLLHLPVDLAQIISKYTEPYIIKVPKQFDHSFDRKRRLKKACSRNDIQLVEENREEFSRRGSIRLFLGDILLAVVTHTRTIDLFAYINSGLYTDHIRAYVKDLRKPQLYAKLKGWELDGPLFFLLIEGKDIHDNAKAWLTQKNHPFVRTGTYENSVALLVNELRSCSLAD
jgi:hypothetical protein